MLLKLCCYKVMLLHHYFATLFYCSIVKDLNINYLNCNLLSLYTYGLNIL